MQTCLGSDSVFNKYLFVKYLLFCLKNNHRGYSRFWDPLLPNPTPLDSELWGSVLTQGQ